MRPSATGRPPSFSAVKDAPALWCTAHRDHAAHCGTSETSISFGETEAKPARRSRRNIAAFQGSNGPVDNGLRLFAAETRDDVPIVPI